MFGLIRLPALFTASVLALAAALAAPAPLGVGGPGLAWAQAGAGSPAGDSSARKAEVETVQRLLKLLAQRDPERFKGVDPGVVDGETGPRTLDAIAKFQRTIGVPVTRRVDRELWVQLITAQVELLGTGTAAGASTRGCADDPAAPGCATAEATSLGQPVGSGLPAPEAKPGHEDTPFGEIATGNPAPTEAPPLESAANVVQVQPKEPDGHRASGPARSLAPNNLRSAQQQGQAVDQATAVLQTETRTATQDQTSKRPSVSGTAGSAVAIPLPQQTDAPKETAANGNQSRYQTEPTQSLMRVLKSIWNSDSYYGIVIGFVAFLGAATGAAAVMGRRRRREEEYIRRLEQLLEPTQKEASKELVPSSLEQLLCDFDRPELCSSRRVRDEFLREILKKDDFDKIGADNNELALLINQQLKNLLVTNPKRYKYIFLTLVFLNQVGGAIARREISVGQLAPSILRELELVRAYFKIHLLELDDRLMLYSRMPGLFRCLQPS